MYIQIKLILLCLFTLIFAFLLQVYEYSKEQNHATILVSVKWWAVKQYST